MSSNKDTLDCFLLAVATFFFVMGVMVYASMKASAFTRATGKPLSAWDALFLDVRVEAPPIPPSTAGPRVMEGR